MKILLLGLIALSLNSIPNNQCDIKMVYRVEDTSNGQDNGKIYLTIVQGSTPFEVNLYDKYEPSKGFIKTVYFENYEVGREVLVFQRLKSSSYIVRIDNTKCKTSISGLDGIIIN